MIAHRIFAPWAARLLTAVSAGFLAACGNPGPPAEAGSPAPADPIASLPAGAQPAAESARAAAAGFSAALREKLSAAVLAGGAVGAIDVCQIEAPRLAADHSRRLGGTLRRTSLKSRNDANDPEDWEIDALENFAARLQAGTNPARLESFTLLPDATPPSLRYTRAIVVESACLTCHGESIAPPIQAKITATYPGDRATGYREGDLRGLLSVVLPLAPGEPK